MKISDLAALVTVRNHILTVINDTSASSRDEFKALNTARISLDKKFVKIITEDDAVDDLFPNELTIVKVGGQPSVKDLENWRKIFEEAKNDPDFKIFTHNDVGITQIEVGPKSNVRVLPAVEPRTIEVSRDVSVTKKGQLTLPLEKKRAKAIKQAQEILEERAAASKKVEEAIDNVKKGSDKDMTVVSDDVIDRMNSAVSTIGSELGIPLKKMDDIPPSKLEGGGRSGDIDTTKKQVQAAVDELAQGNIPKLEESLDKLDEQGVKLTPAVVEEAAKPIKAPEEKKKKVVKKAKEPTKSASVDQDPDFQEALKREKAALKKQGRSNKKIEKNEKSG